MVNLEPILIQKTGDQFWTIRLSEIQTERDDWLFNVVHTQIGVNLNNPDGLYYFNAIMVEDENRLIYSMVKIDEEFAKQVHRYPLGH